MSISECHGLLADVVFVAQRPITEENEIILLDFIGKMIDRFNLGDNKTHIGFVEYGDAAQSRFNLNRYFTPTEIKSALNMDGNVGLYTTGGIMEMHDKQFTAANGDRPGIPNIAILITDRQSVDQRQQANAIEAAESAQQAGIKMFTIALNIIDHDAFFHNNPSFFDAMSSSPHRQGLNYWIVDSYDKLENIALITDTIAAAICREKGI